VIDRFAIVDYKGIRCSDEELRVRDRDLVSVTAPFLIPLIALISQLGVESLRLCINVP